MKGYKQTHTYTQTDKHKNIHIGLNYILSPYLLPKYELIFGKDLRFVIVIFSCSIPTTHDILYRETQNGNTVKNISVTNFKFIS